MLEVETFGVWVDRQGALSACPVSWSLEDAPDMGRGRSDQGESCTRAWGGGREDTQGNRGWRKVRRRGLWNQVRILNTYLDTGMILSQ